MAKCGGDRRIWKPFRRVRVIGRGDLRVISRAIPDPDRPGDHVLRGFVQMADR
jgi:hypothetical protein